MRATVSLKEEADTQSTAPEQSCMDVVGADHSEQTVTAFNTLAAHLWRPWPCHTVTMHVSVLLDTELWSKS